MIVSDTAPDGPAPERVGGGTRRPCGHDASSADPCFDCFYRENATMFARCSARLCALYGVADETQDILQDALAELLRRWSSEITYPRSYLYRSIRNRAYDEADRRRRHQGRHRRPDVVLDAAALERLAGGPVPEAAALRADLRRVLAEAIDGLPPLAGQVVLCRLVLELSPAETAVWIGGDVTGSAISSALHRATTTLRGLLPAELLADGGFADGDYDDHGRHGGPDGGDGR